MSKSVVFHQTEEEYVEAYNNKRYSPHWVAIMPPNDVELTHYALAGMLLVTDDNEVVSPILPERLDRSIVCFRGHWYRWREIK